MTIDRTDPTIAWNYLTFPYAVEPKTWQQTAAKVAAIAFHILLSIVSFSYYYSCTQAKYLKDMQDGLEPLQIRQIDRILDNINGIVLRNETTPDQVQFNRECLKAVEIYRKGFDEVSGELVEKNIAKAMVILKYLKENGDYMATAILTDIYFQEEAICPDPHELFNLAREADNFELLLKLADNNHPKAMYVIGKACYEGSAGFTQNIKRAMSYFERAANQGESSACTFLAKKLLFGEADIRNVEEGGRFLLQAFDNGATAIEICENVNIFSKKEASQFLLDKFGLDIGIKRDLRALELERELNQGQVSNGVSIIGDGIFIL